MNQQLIGKEINLADAFIILRLPSNITVGNKSQQCSVLNCYPPTAMHRIKGINLVVL